MATRFFPLYNIDQPVGPGKANIAADVRLVQALFIETSRFDAGDWLAEVPANLRTLATTGTFDDKLKSWILAFQTWAARGFGGSKVFMYMCSDMTKAAMFSNIGISIDWPSPVRSRWNSAIAICCTAISPTMWSAITIGT